MKEVLYTGDLILMNVTMKVLRNKFWEVEDCF